MKNEGTARPSGSLGQEAIRRVDLSRPPVGWTLSNWLRYRRRDLPKLAAVRFIGSVPGILTAESLLRGLKYSLPVEIAYERLRRLQELLGGNVDVRELMAIFGGRVTDYGVLSTRVVTDAGVAFIVDAFQNLTELENLKFHGFGVGTTAEGASQTALVTELTTEYASDNVRPTGTTTEGATANIYRTVATLSPDSGGTLAITEHGIFSQAAVAGGTMLDRSVFSAVNLVAGSDSLQVTYDLTLSSGG
jgi:hypothetical protein